jgi:hypothetical protein
MSLFNTNQTNLNNQISIYKNNNLNRFYTSSDLSDIIQNMNNINLSDESYQYLGLNNNYPLKRYHTDSLTPNSSSTLKVPYAKTYLSNDNIRLMDACDFYNGKNPITAKECVETFISKLENDYIEEQNNKPSQLSLDDKIYLTICSAGFVYLLFKFSDKYNL